MAWLKNNYQFEFTDTLTTSWMSVRISNEKENGAVATFTDQYVTARSEDNSIVERMKGSASAWVLTLSMRGLDQTDTDTQVPWLKRERREWTKVFVTYVASQHVDAKGNNTFSWTQTFENITVSNNSALTNATVSGKYKWPVVADVIARDALYPTPVWWNEVFVQSLNAKQVYNAGTSQRETQAVGTPAPDATEAVKGIAKIGTQSEVDTWTDDTVIVTPKKLKKQQPEALVDKNTYVLWENCIENDSLFTETSPTFAESTTIQNIWDVTANTRVTLYDFGSGSSGSTQKLALVKTLSPSVNLSVRLETLDGSGNPTWTLVDANSVAAIAADLLPPSLTWPASVDATDSSATTDTVLSQTQSCWYRILSKYTQKISTFTKAATCTATRCIIKSDAGAVLKTVSFVWNVATLNFFVGQSVYYRIEVDNNGSLYNINRTWAWTYPTWTNIDYIAWSINWSNTTNFEWNVSISTLKDIEATITFPWSFTIPLWQKYWVVLNAVGNLVDGTNYYGVGYVARDTTTRQTKLWNGAVWSSGQTNRFYYTSSTLSLPTVLSKTDADYTYKLPTDFPRVANEAGTAGDSVLATYYGVRRWFTWLSNSTYYVWNTPWLISTTPWTNPYVIWQWINPTMLKISWKNLNKSITVTASPFSYTNSKGWPIQVKITWWTVNPIVINWVTVATATGHINTLSAGATMTVTYSVLPTITYSDL